MPLFSYGTLQDEAVQLSCYGRVLPGVPDAVSGYLRSTLSVDDTAGPGSRRCYPVVDASGGDADKVLGVVFRITEPELASTDAYEGAEYRRVMARLDSGLDAWVYVRA